MKKSCCLGVLLFFLQLYINAQPPLSGSVKMFQGRPTIFINDQPVSPQFYSLTHEYGGRWSWEEVPSRNLKNFCEQSYKLYQVDLYFQDIWSRDKDQLDIAKAQRQVRGVLDACPDAGVVIRVHVNAPYWWNEEHREECTQYADGPVDTRSYGPPNDNENGDIDRPLRASLASVKWRKDASDKLSAFCEQLANTPEGRSVIGIHIACGVFGEWHYWGFPFHDPDISTPMTNYFRQWLKTKYKNDKALQTAWHSREYDLSNATVPGKAERDTTYDGFFRDPQREQRVIDYYDCQQQVVAEDIIHFAGVVKKSWPRPVIVGVFYNYFFMTFGRQAAGGHLKQGMILNCPDIDYLSAPQSYWGGARRIGGSGQSRGLVESAVLHGKLWLDEMDQNSYKGGPFNSGVFTTREQDVAMIRRNLAQAFTRGAGYWMYDFGPYRSSGWWDDTLLLRDIGKVHAILDRYYQRPFTHPADVLFVYSSQVFYYIKNVNTTISSYNICDQQSIDAFQAGALIDQIYFADLRKVDLKKYRTIVFSNPFCLTDAERKYLKDTVAKDGRTIVWNYMPGYSDEERNDLRFVEDVTGMKLKLAAGSNPLLASTTGDYPLTGVDTLKDIRPLAYIDDPKVKVLGTDKRTGGIMVAKKSFPDHTVWYNSYLFRQPAVFRKIFQESGAHIYGDQDDVFYESSGLLMVHTKSGGEKTIHLRNGKSISIQLAPESTRYLDAETGEVIL